MNRLIYIIAFTFYGLFNLSAQAGGMALGGTRIVYPLQSQQVEVSTRNTSEKSTFLVQSWIEDKEGNKDNSFFVTPPLFVSKPGNENKMRIFYKGKELPKDRESLFYFNSKAVPSVKKSDTENKNVLVIAATTRIKLFVRPENLPIAPDKAPEKLIFSRSDKQITITNPTPYYITIGEMKIGNEFIKEALMLPPKGNVSKIFSATSPDVTIRTINDFGAYTPPLKFTLK